MWVFQSALSGQVSVLSSLNLIANIVNCRILLWFIDRRVSHSQARNNYWLWNS